VIALLLALGLLGYWSDANWIVLGNRVHVDARGIPHRLATAVPAPALPVGAPAAAPLPPVRSEPLATNSLAPGPPLIGQSAAPGTAPPGPPPMPMNATPPAPPPAPPTQP
jgi:hypothetical protein